MFIKLTRPNGWAYTINLDQIAYIDWPVNGPATIFFSGTQPISLTDVPADQVIKLEELLAARDRPDGITDAVRAALPHAVVFQYGHPTPAGQFPPEKTFTGTVP